MLQSQIVCHKFLCLSPPRPLWNLLMETRDMPKELGLLYVDLLTGRLYIQLDQFIIVQVILPTLYHQMPSIFILVFKVYIWTSWTLWLCWTSESLLDITLPHLQQSWLSSTRNLSRSILRETRILLSQLSVDFKKKLFLNLFIGILVMSLSFD